MGLREVLVVDDNDSDLLYTDIILSKAGIARTVRTFETGAAALVHLHGPGAAEVDLILLDLNMPEMSGFEFLSLYQPLYDAGRVAARVAILTSSGDDADKRASTAYGCVKFYLIKPIDLAKAAELSAGTAT